MAVGIAGRVRIVVVALLVALTVLVALAAASEVEATTTPNLVPFKGTLTVTCTWNQGDARCPNGYHAPDYKAIDFGGRVGTPVLAAGDGTVVAVQTGCVKGNVDCGGGWGNHVVIRHGDGADARFSRYAHLHSSRVRVGDPVVRGCRIGRVGSTGESTGAHLHYQEEKPLGNSVVPGVMRGVVNGEERVYPDSLGNGISSWPEVPWGAKVRNQFEAPQSECPTRRCAGKVANIVGTSKSEILLGLNGRDVVVAGAGADTIKTFGGNDLICGNDGQDTILAHSGDDVVFGGAHGDTIRGAGGNDILHGGDGADDIAGGAGNDELFGNVGADKLKGNSGRDFLSGGLGADILWGHIGADELRGGDQSDTLNGGDGPDDLFGEAGNQDLLRGQNGNDDLDGGPGSADRCLGGDGTDTVTECELGGP